MSGSRPRGAESGVSKEAGGGALLLAAPGGGREVEKKKEKKRLIRAFFERGGAKKSARLRSGEEVRYRGGRIPEPFRLEASAGLLTARFGSAPRREAEALAAFDFDETLARNNFASPEAFASVHRHAGRVLAALQARGFAVAVLTNESMDRLVSRDAVEAKLRHKCGRLANWIAQNGLDQISVYVAISKKTGDMHKSVGDGMWRRARDDLTHPQAFDKARSFFVGDSADDANMAKIADVRYHHVTRFFTDLHPARDYPEKKKEETTTEHHHRPPPV